MLHNHLSFYFDQIYNLNTVKYDKIRYQIVMITMHKLSHAFHVINYYIYHASSHAFSLHKSKWKHNCTNMQMIFFPLVSCMSFFLVWRGGIDFSYILCLLAKEYRVRWIYDIFIRISLLMKLGWHLVSIHCKWCAWFVKLN